jgi:hypothetical protein
VKTAEFAIAPTMDLFVDLPSLHAVIVFTTELDTLLEKFVVIQMDVVFVIVQQLQRELFHNGNVTQSVAIVDVLDFQSLSSWKMVIHIMILKKYARFLNIFLEQETLSFQLKHLQMESQFIFVFFV